MNIKKQKVLMIFGTRPEIIRLSEIIKILSKYCDLKILNTGQNFDPRLNKIFLKELNIKNIDFSINTKFKNLNEFLSSRFLYINKSFNVFNPDKVIILGDTNSAFLAYSYKRFNIPIYHIEAGNRSFDERIPEEINRKIIDHFSDYHFVYSERARVNLLHEGIHTNRIFLIGSPLNEVFEKNKKLIQNSKILTQLNLKDKNYILVSFHRYENISKESNLLSFVNLLNKLSLYYNKKIIVTYHPSLKSNLDGYIKNKKTKFNKNIEFLKPFGYIDYSKLQLHSFITLSDSGSISEESAIMKFNALSIRTSIERQEAIESGVMGLSGLDPDTVINLINLTVSNSKYIENKHDIIPLDYAIKDTSIRFSKILLGEKFI
jgi:UDP-N-acetyl-L-fucosamine synthase